MQPSDPSTSIKWWRDVVVKGSLVTFPENASAGAVLVSILPLTVKYKALYKKTVFYLAVGIAAVLVSAVLIWMLRTAVGGYA
jgi:hypothetical protein